MASSFFSNKDSNTLKNKINNLLEIDKNIEYLDFLIGYFRITGFDKISDNLSPIKHTRILIGINADKYTYNASQLIKKFSKEQVEHYNQEPLDSKAYANFASMKQLIVEQRIEVRISANKDVHAKMYIMRSKALANHQNNAITYRGSVIIGSSNLTHNGLEGNTEINAELTQERDIVEAMTVFETLWKESVELREDDFDTYIIPKLNKPKNLALSPYQLYIKLLIEHFGKKIDFLDDEEIFVPQSYKKLSYQVEAVNDALEKLRKHNGFFLSDVVGLGKTVVIAMLMKRLEDTLEKEILIVIPPAVKNQWEETFEAFEISHFHIVSLASLENINASKYEIIVVDESHKFKNAKSKRYKQLYAICRNKKVILLSATPQNNTPNDLYNQIALFQNLKMSSIESCRNLQSFFEQRTKAYKEIINNEPIDKKHLQEISQEIRDKVLRTLMIRRTRYDIRHHKMYKKDIDAQNLSIPKVHTPKEHEYKLEGKLGIVFKETSIKITKELKYSRFNALGYLTKEAIKYHYPKESENIFSKNPLAGIMKTLLIKRFESSFYAFKISIKRHKKRYEAFIKNYKDDSIYLGDRASDILDYSNNEEDYEKYIQDLILRKKVKVLQRSDFKAEFEEHLNADYNLFKKLVSLWEKEEEDPKLEKFKVLLKKDTNPKIVIFTESVDTVNYLQSKFKENKNILFITSQNREEKNQTIKENFDANYDLLKQKDDYTMIITTDTLAEGINLHRSNTIYNYDIPWNATKLIQRIGRVNRIGTQAQNIYIHNFKPASDIEDLIKLSQKAFVKLQSSHTMMGEDNQIYSKEEEVTSVSLFDAYEKESQESDEELNYLEELRDFREQDKAQFEYISASKQGQSLTRKHSQNAKYIMLDINRQNTYVRIENKKISKISFVSFAKALKAKVEEEPLTEEKSLAEASLSQAIKHFEEAFKQQKQDKAGEGISDAVSQKALSYLKEWLKQKLLDRPAFVAYRKAILEGSLGLLAIEEINQLYHLEAEEIKQKLSTIIKQKQKKEHKLFDEHINIHLILAEVFKEQ